MQTASGRRKKLGCPGYVEGVPVSGSRHPRQDEDCKNKNQTLRETNTPNNSPRNIINIGKLKVMYTNADGLVNKKDEHKVLLQSLTEKFDILAIT